MKHLTPLNIDNLALVTEFSNRRNLSSHPRLHAELNGIVEQYQLYQRARGNVLELHRLESIDEALADSLRTHYKSEIKGLEFIEEIRNNLSPDICPMCGSLGSAEIDHVAPKEFYPEFSFFSYNLVPACSCNNKKSVTYRDERLHARVLHPYFDEILRNRLVYLKYSGELETPKIEIVAVEQYEEDLDVVFHIENVLKKSSLRNWKARAWVNLFRNPSAFLNSLNQIAGEVAFDDVRAVVEAKLIEYDNYYGTPNNWFSMMFYGLHSNMLFLTGLAEKENRIRARGYLLE